MPRKKRQSFVRQLSGASGITSGGISPPGKGSPSGGISGISIGSFFWNSLMYAVLAVAGVVLSSSLTAYAFAKIRFAGRNLLFTLMIGTLLLSIGVAYSGAYVRHTGAELACTSWPTCNGQLIPEFEGLAGIHTLHRLAALVIGLAIGALLVWAVMLNAPSVSAV